MNRSRTPLWQRNQWPLVWHEDVLVAVPGLGIHHAYSAASENCVPYYITNPPPGTEDVGVCVIPQ